MTMTEVHAAEARRRNGGGGRGRKGGMKWVPEEWQQDDWREQEEGLPSWVNGAGTLMATGGGEKKKRKAGMDGANMVSNMALVFG